MTNILDTHVSAYEGNNLYDFDNNIQLNWYPERIIRHIEKTHSLLELGLGHGITTDFFSKYCTRHVVIDASPAVISSFKKSYPNCNSKIIECYFENYESSEKFDVIILGFVLEHVDDPVEIMRYYKQFLAPEGKMFLAVPNAEVLNRKLGHIAGLLPDMHKLSEHDLLCGHKRYYSVKTLSEDIAKAGCEIVLLEGIYLKPFTTEQMISLNFDERIINALCVAGIDYPELCCGMLAQIKTSSC